MSSGFALLLMLATLSFFGFALTLRAIDADTLQVSL